MTDIFFKSEGHKTRFLEGIQAIGKVYDGMIDQEYGAALYLLTANLSIWDRISEYVGRFGIDVPTMLKEVHFSSGEATLVMLAGNLLNNQTQVNALDLVFVDNGNFNVALTALQLRRKSLRIDDIK